MFRFEIPSRDSDFVQFLESFDFTIKICEYDFFFFKRNILLKKFVSYFEYSNLEISFDDVIWWYFRKREGNVKIWGDHFALGQSINYLSYVASGYNIYCLH